MTDLAQVKTVAASLIDDEIKLGRYKSGRGDLFDNDRAAALMAELQLVARRGYAVDDCELFEDLRCVAVPIVNRSGQVVAALSASSNASHLPRSQLGKVAKQLSDHASTIAERLYPEP